MIYKSWKEYPSGTKAYSLMGGYWIKLENGMWKWHNGDSFPSPGADTRRIELPRMDDEIKHE